MVGGESRVLVEVGGHRIIIGIMGRVVMSCFCHRGVGREGIVMELHLDDFGRVCGV